MCRPNNTALRTSTSSLANELCVILRQEVGYPVLELLGYLHEDLNCGRLYDLRPQDIVPMSSKESAMFACTKCNSRHPFDELSQGQQLCKVSVAYPR